MLLSFSKHPQAFLNDFCLYACASHSTSNLDTPLLSISTFSHQFFCTSLVLGLSSSLNSFANSSTLLHETETFLRDKEREWEREIERYLFTMLRMVGEKLRSERRVQGTSFNTEEEIRRYRNAGNHVFEDESLMFKLLPLS